MKDWLAVTQFFQNCCNSEGQFVYRELSDMWKILNATAGFMLIRAVDGGKVIVRRIHADARTKMQVEGPQRLELYLE
jgi:hypothetical protein